MSLLDSLLLEGYRDPREVYIALRADGQKGSGTIDDPYDGSRRDYTAIGISTLSKAGTEATAVKSSNHGFVSGDMVTINGVMKALEHSLVPVRFALALLLVLFAATMHAATVGYPRGTTTSIAWAREPFALNQLNLTSCRYQQVYDASRFSEILPDGGALPDGGTITQLVFVVDNQFPRGFSTVFPDIQIDFSVTSRSPNQLSTNFSDNLGTKTVAVLPRGQLSMVSSGDPGSRVVINLPVAFFYNPAEGNLLLDIRIFAPNPPHSPFGYPGVFDAFNVESDSVSRVFSYDVNSPSGTADTLGLTTIFEVIPPATPRLLFFVSATNLVLWWFRVPAEYTLQQSPVLGPGASWQPFGGTVFSHQEYLEARVPVNPNDATRFFRLISQPSPGAAILLPNNARIAVPKIGP